ncbi:MAG: deoxyribodipyrimidine photolyase [Zavarzinella sp.]
MPTFNDYRIRKLNDAPLNPSGSYVFYWMQISRRMTSNHALDYAVHMANELKHPLVIYEGLRLDYPWANARHHTFLLQGMKDNYFAAKKLGVNYWPYLETASQPARGLLHGIVKNASLIVTDDYPVFIVPQQSAAVAGKTDVQMVAVDSNCMIPLELLGEQVKAAAHIRPRIHRLFVESYGQQATANPLERLVNRSVVAPPFELWEDWEDPAEVVSMLPIDQSVTPVATTAGGAVAAQNALDYFVTNKLHNYSEGRNNPDDPARTAASGLSVYLRNGHLAIQDVVNRVLHHDEPWTPDKMNLANKNKREGYFCGDPNVNSFLDEALTWRDVGYHWHHCRNKQHGIPQVRLVDLDGETIPTYYDLKSTLPEWAQVTLGKHDRDQRDYTYSLQEWENSATHDELWNAAQTELVTTGKIHNYLRMLWGKKVLEWSPDHQTAYTVLEHLNNKYALDGRDPNSYTGILWCFGLFDRPWAPERQVFGSIRFMSSGNTAKKYKLDGYYRYVRGLKKRQSS